eukprot:2711985-Pleurochrysis_carterae.AAC.1
MGGHGGGDDDDDDDCGDDGSDGGGGGDHDAGDGSAAAAAAAAAAGDGDDVDGGGDDDGGSAGDGDDGDEGDDDDVMLPVVLRVMAIVTEAVVCVWVSSGVHARLIAGPAKTCFAEVLDVRDDACMIVRDHALGSPRVATVGRRVETRLRLMLAGCAKLLVFKPSGEALAGVGRGQTAQRRSSSDGQTTDKMRRSDKMMRKLYL